MEIYHIKDIFKVYVAQCGIECVGRCLSYFAVDFGILVFAADGEVEKVDVWGVKKLAYPIEKKEEGYYVVIEFKAEATLPYELDRKLKISDNVIRHIIINKDEQ